MAQIGKREQEIINYLKEQHPKGATAKEISQATGQALTGKYGGIYRTLHRLEDKGAVWSRKEKGIYRWHADAIFLLFKQEEI